MSDEETVRVGLGDDYYQGAYFVTEGGHLDYEVPRSQLERWEAAEAAYADMQGEIEGVMEQQHERARALLRARREVNGDPSTFWRDLPTPAVNDSLRTQLMDKGGE